MAFQVGLTPSLFTADGSPAFDFGLDELERSGLRWEVLDSDAAEFPAAVLDQYDSVIAELPGDFRAPALLATQRLRHIARVGVGYDNIDLAACSEAGIVVTNTPDAVRRPMATAALTLVLALSQHLVQRDRVARRGDWEGRGAYLGTGLRQRRLGLVGLGNIGREVARLAAPFEFELVAADPFVTAAAAREVGCQLLELDELIATSRFVVLTAALTPQTQNLISAERIAALRSDAQLINISRGALVDQAALTAALSEKRIAGAGLDVTDPEPFAADDPLLGLDSVVLTAHSIGWTDDCFRDCGLSAIRAVVDISQQREPAYPVNRDAFAHPYWKGKRT